MAGTRAAIRYAKALLDLAQGDNTAAAVLEDVKHILETLSANKELRLVLQSPVVKGSDKLTILQEVFKGAQEHTLELITTLVANKRANLLGLVAQRYEDLYNKSQGVQTAKVISAVALTSDLEKKVLVKVKELTGSDNVKIENEIDATIIGGFILRVGDLQYNASIANQLTRLKREFSNSL